MIVPLGFFPDNTTITHRDEVIYPAPGIPFGMYILGTAFSEFELIGMAYAYEQATHTRLAGKAYSGASPKTQLLDVMDRTTAQFMHR